MSYDSADVHLMSRFCNLYFNLNEWIIFQSSNTLFEQAHYDYLDRPKKV